MVSVVTLLSLSLVPPTHAALPPGHEDELYCPPDYCMRKKDIDEEMAGPLSGFVECVGPAGDVVEVTPWGPLLENADDVKDMLLDQGFHMEECMTCGMIKAAYKKSHCCGNPSHPFHDMEAGDHRRLSPVSRTKGDTAIVASIRSAFRRAKAEGGREEAARLANKILGVLQAHGQH